MILANDLCEPSVPWSCYNIAHEIMDQFLNIHLNLSPLFFSEPEIVPEAEKVRSKSKSHAKEKTKVAMEAS